MVMSGRLNTKALSRVTRSKGLPKGQAAMGLPRSASGMQLAHHSGRFASREIIMIERRWSMAIRGLVLAAILCGGDAPVAAVQLGIPGLESGPGVAPQPVSVSAQFTVAGGSKPARLFITAEIAD